MSELDNFAGDHLRSCQKCWQKELPCNCGSEKATTELAQLRRLRDNYKATSELLAIREEQIGELLNEKAQLRAALDEARKVIEDLVFSRSGEENWHPASAWWDKWKADNDER